MAVQIILKNSSVEDKRPTANQLANGELSLNYHEAGAFLCCRDTDGNIQQVGGIKVSEDAPGTPVLGSLWFQASTQSLFVHNGTSWLEAASGGGGGGGGTAGVTRLIAADGIDALPASGTGVVTINADLDTERGLEFVAGEIAVNLGVGLEFNAATGAIDATASALQYRGTVDLTTGTVPAGPVLGDTYANTGDGAFDAAWVTATGESAGTDADPGDLVVWNGTVFTFVPTGGGGGGGVTNLSYTPTTGGTASQGGTVVSDTGTNADIPMVGYSEVGVLGDAAQAGLMSPTDKTKLDGINIDGDGNVTNIAQQQADWDEVDTAEPTFIQNKPTINVNGDGDITNVRVDLGYTAAANGGTVTNDSGDDASIPFATAANAGLYLEPGTPAATTQFARQVTDAGAASWVAVTGGGGASVTVGPAADRPLSPSDGELFHNTDNDTLWVWVNTDSTWQPAVPQVPTGGGDDYTTAVAGERCFFNNEQQIDENYTVTSTTNSLSAGPITVDGSATVTVESGGTWTVVGGSGVTTDPAGFWSRDGGTGTLSPANSGDDLDNIGRITAAGELRGQRFASKNNDNIASYLGETNDYDGTTYQLLIVDESGGGRPEDPKVRAGIKADGSIVADNKIIINPDSVTASDDRTRLQIGEGAGTARELALLYTTDSAYQGPALKIQHRYSTNSNAKFLECVKGTDTVAEIGLDGSASFLADGFTVNETGSYGVQLKTDRDRFLCQSVSGGAYLQENGTSWVSNSDKRLKKDLVTIENGLDKVGQLNGYTGHFKTDDVNSKRRSFLVAQEVQAVLPEAVDASNPLKLGVSYTDVIPLLVSALNESKDRIEALEAQLAALSGPSTTDIQEGN